MGWLPLLLWGFPKVEYPTDGRFGGRVIGQVDHENAINIYWGKHKLDWNPPAVSRWVGGHTVCVNVKKLSDLSGYWISIYVWRPKMQQKIEMKCHFESPKQIQRKREKGKNLNLNLKNWDCLIKLPNITLRGHISGKKSNVLSTKQKPLIGIPFNSSMEGLMLVNTCKCAPDLKYHNAHLWNSFGIFGGNYFWTQIWAYLQCQNRPS